MLAFDAFTPTPPAHPAPQHAAIRPETRFPRCALIELTPADRQRLLAHLQTLDADDRLLRFGHAVRNDALASYVNGIDFDRDQVCGLVDEHAHILALAHLAVRDGEVDFGLSVTPACRQQGMGKLLFHHVIQRALDAGASRVLCHSISPAILRMANARGFRRLRGNPTAPLVLQLLATPPAVKRCDADAGQRNDACTRASGPV